MPRDTITLDSLRTWKDSTSNSVKAVLMDQNLPVADLPQSVSSSLSMMGEYLLPQYLICTANI